VLCVLVDLAPVDGRSPAEQERILLRELGDHEPALLERPRLVVGTKADVASMAWNGTRMSAVTGEGVPPVVASLASLVAEARNAEPISESFVVHRPVPEGIDIERLADHELRVNGRAALRAVALSDLTNSEALAFVDQRLKRLGVDRALARAGARSGDVVWIGDFSFTYEPDA
jgi:GTP-binding protein